MVKYPEYSSKFLLKLPEHQAFIVKINIIQKNTQKHMVSNNEYIKQIIEQPKVEEVREIKEEVNPTCRDFIVQSFQERQILIANKSKLSPAARAKVIKKYGSDYLSEKAFNKDIAMYGPGFWDDFLKPVGRIAISTVVAGSIVATGGATAPLLLATGATGYGVGKLVSKTAEECDSEGWKWVGDTISDTGVGVVTGGLVGTTSKSLVSKGASSVFNAGVRTAGTNGSKVLLNAWIYTKAAQIGYDLGGKGKVGMQTFCYFFHNKHKERGIGYDSECPICNGHFDKYFSWI